MDKKTLVVVLLVACCVRSHAQQPSGQVSLQDSLSAVRFTMDDSTGRALADYAASSVELKMLDKQIEAGMYDWKTSKASLLNNISANFNFNGRTFGSSSALQSNVFYPWYNFQLNLPIGDLFTKPAQAKKAKVQYQGLQLQREAATRDIRQLIIEAYQDYMMNRYLVSVQDAIIRDESESFDEVERKFKGNAVTIEQYTAASRRLSETLIQRITALRNLNVAKYSLERLIGATLEDALAAIRKKQGGK